MPPPNTTCLTADVLASFPADVTIARDGASEVWWTFTTGPVAKFYSVLLSTDGTHTYRLSEGSCAGLSNLFTENRAVHIQKLAANTQYWIRGFSFSGGVTSIRVRVEEAPDEPLEDGSLIVPHVFSPARWVVISPSGEILKVMADYPSGLAGDSLGSVLLNQDGSDAKLYDADLQLVATAAGLFSGAPTQPGSIRANLDTQTFWVGARNAGGTLATISTVDRNGNIGATSWSFATASALQAILPARDEGILYWVQLTNDNAIHRYDLVNSVALSDLTTHLADHVTNRSLILLADDTIVQGLRSNIGAASHLVRRYDASGTLLSTYDVDAHQSGYVLVGLVRELPESTRVWVWTSFPGGKAANPEVKMRLTLVDMATVTEVSSFEFVDFDGGVGADNWQEPPDMFGPDSTGIAFTLGPSAPPLPVRQIDNTDPCCADCSCPEPTAGGGQPAPGHVGPVPPPLVPEIWYRRCEGGGEVPSAADVPDPEDWADETPPKQPDSWLTVRGAAALAEEDEHWGKVALSDDGRYVAGRLLEVSSIERGSSDKDGNYTPARLRVVEQDDDATLRVRLADPDRQHLINREAAYHVLSYAGRKAGLDPLPLLQGRIVNVQPELERRGIIEVQDIVGAQYGVLDPEKPIGVPIGDEHPGRPDETKDKIYPVILGEHSDAGSVDEEGHDVAVGMLPAYDCGNEFVDHEVSDGVPATPDPDGREFNLGLAQPDDQAIVNVLAGGDITATTWGLVAPIIAGEIGPPSQMLVLNPNGNGAGGPAAAHAHRHVWMDVPGGADEYIVWLTTNPLFHPVTNPAGDLNARYQIVSGSPTNPAFPPRPQGGTWEFFADFTSLTDGDQWGVQTVSGPQNLAHTITTSPSGTRRFVYSVSAITTLGETPPVAALVVEDAPDVLGPGAGVELTWDPPAEHPESVTGYRVIGRDVEGLTHYLAIVGDGSSPVPTTYTDEGQDHPKVFTPGLGAIVSENVWAWMVCALGEADIHQVYGSDGAEVEGEAPKRRLIEWDEGIILGPYSAGWPHAEPYRVVGGIRQTGFYARLGTVALNHHREGRVTFAWNGCGWKDEDGLVIDQAYRMLLMVLNEAVEKNDGEGYRDGDFGPIEEFSDGTPKFKTTAFEAAQDLTKEWLSPDSPPVSLGYIGAIAITEPTPLREFLRRFFVTFGGHLTTNHRGQMYPYLLNPDAADGRLFRERREIKRLQKHWYAHEQRENRVTYSYHFNFDQKVFRNQNLVIEHTASITQHGGARLGVFEKAVKECFYGNDADTMTDRWDRFLQLYAYPPRFVEWVSSYRSLADANGDAIRFSHRKEGLGVTGETETPGQLISTVVDDNVEEIIQTSMLFRGAEGSP